MADIYAEAVQAVVVEADRRAAQERRERVNRGVALAQLLARTADLHYKSKSIQSWMRGDTMPPADVLLAVAHGTGISLDERLGIGREPSEVERQLAAVQEELAQQRNATATMQQRLEELAARLEPQRPAPAPRSVEELESAIGLLADEMADVGSRLQRSWDEPEGISYRDLAASPPERLKRRVDVLVVRMAEVAGIVGAAYGGYPDEPAPGADQEAARGWLERVVGMLEVQMRDVRARVNELTHGERSDRPEPRTGERGA